MTQQALLATPTYTAIINFDIKGSGSAATQRNMLYGAMQHLGWEKAKTSALTIETADVNNVWKGILAFVKMQTMMGTLSAVSVTVQRTDEPGTSVPAASKDDYDAIVGFDFPWGSKEQI